MIVLENSNIHDSLSLVEESLSPFQYHDDVKVLEKFSRAPDKDEVIYNYNTGFFNINDLHIVNVIAKLHFATFTQICATIDFLKKQGHIKTNISEKSDFIKSRLGTLCSAGIVQRVKFYPYKNKIMKNLSLSSYYFVTAHGYHFLKRIMEYKEPYDEYLAITPVEEVFKFLSNNTLLNKLFEVDNFKNFYNNSKYFYKEKRRLLNMTGIVTFSSKAQDEEIVVYIEPIKFSFNENRISKEQLKENIIEKCECLKNILSNISDDKQKYVIFLVENMKGIQYMGNFVKNYLIDFIDYIYIASDAAIYMGDLDSSFLKFKYMDNSIKIELAKPYFLGD